MAGPLVVGGESNKVNNETSVVADKTVPDGGVFGDKNVNIVKPAEIEFDINSSPNESVSKDILAVDKTEKKIEKVDPDKAKAFLESSDKTVTPLSKTEQVFLMAQLQEAIDEYNGIIEKAMKVEEDLETRASEDKDFNRNALKLIREATYPGTNFNVERRKLEALAKEIEDKIAREEMGELGRDLEGIEPAKDKALAILEKILLGIDSLNNLDKLQASLSKLVGEISTKIKESGEFQIDLKADMDAMCENRRAEIEVKPKESTPETKLAGETGAGEEPKAVELKAKTDDDFSVGSAGLADESDALSDQKKPEITGEAPALPSDTTPEESSQEETFVATLPDEPAEFQEFDQIDSTGKIVASDPVEHKEVYSNKSEGLSAEQLEKLKGKGNENKNTGKVIDLVKEALTEKVELPKHVDKKAQIQARLAVLRNQPQAEVDSRIFGQDDEVIKDADNKPLNLAPTPDSEIATTSELTKSEQAGETEEVELPDAFALETAAAGPKIESKAEDDQKSQPTLNQPKTEKYKIFEPVPTIKPVEAKSAEVVADEEKLPKEKKGRLFDRLKDIIGLGENIDSKKLSTLDKAVRDERSSTVQEIAEKS